MAQETIKATTQSYVRNSVHPIERRFKTKAAALRYNHLKCTLYSDAMFFSAPSFIQTKCSQIFTTNFGFTKFVPMKGKGEAAEVLRELITYIGIPEHIHMDGAKEMMLGNWRKTCNELGIRMLNTEKSSPWQNRAETEIREVKKHTRRLLHKTRSPIELWDFCMSYVTKLRNGIVHPLPAALGRAPYKIITGNTPNISE